MAGKRRKATASPPPDPEPAPSPAEAPAEAAVAPAPSCPFPIVGVGASAGGLEAFTQMLGALPVDTGMAFVLVQHLAPKHASLLADILSRATTMPVTEVHDEPRVKPNRIYVIPPDRNMIISQGALQLLPREKDYGLHRPIDFFLRSLAKDQRHRAIGVILSGNATDGTLGLAEVKAEGGITFAQDDSAQQSSMPRSAVASGCVDFVLPPDEIAREIGRIASHPYVAQAAPRSPSKRKAPEGEPDLGKILKAVRKATGVDFTQYKASTLFRRVTRRMIVHKMEGLQDYARFLQKNPGEAEALYQDILISVTSFFRNPETFEALKTTILPKLFKDRSRNEPLRVWVPGCATGEEAYSLAIIFAELAESKGSSQLPVQIFASDLNGAGIDKARAGVYSKNITHDVSPERLRRFFAEVEGSYRVTKSIRDMCVFARHNVMTDPPFSQIDLISCRNLLIYMEPALQQKIVPLLHFALKPDGYLLLGSSETIGFYRDLFHAEDAKHKIYAKKPAAHRLARGHAPGVEPDRELSHGADRAQQGGARVTVQKEADRILLARYVPPGVLVDGDLEILQFRGDTGPYLAPAPGKASLNLLRMAREGLVVTLRSAINKAKKEEASIREEGLWVKSNGALREVNLEVVPIRGSSALESGFLILFEEPTSPLPSSLLRRREDPGKASKPQAEPATGEEAAARKNNRLAQELAATREYLQSVIAQQEAANEELQSANEEVQSGNEELQSINEELETSREEIQSSNQELATVNDELHDRNLVLHRLNDDLVNLLGGVEMGIVILGQDLRVRRFTPIAEKAFNLIPSDIGRPIGEIKLNLSLSDLGPLLAEVIDTVSAREREVQDLQGHWYSLRIRPYRTLEDKADGAVILLVDVDKLKQLEEALSQRLEDLAGADRSKNEFLALLAHELRNPLAPLRNAVEVVETPGADPAAVERAQAIMARQIHNMARMIDDLLDVARITQGKVLLHKQLVDLAAVINGGVELARQQIEARGQELSLSLPSEPVELDADPTRLEQVFGNLLNNATKFTPKGGHLWLTAELVNGGSQPPGEVVVRVRDDGVGMAPETVPTIFDLFMQADRSLDRARGGLGIGLTLVHRLIALHGGTVEAHSAGLGKGSELVVRLPVLPPRAGAESERRDGPGGGAAAVPAPSSAAGSPRRVLVVDDNMDMVDSLALLLRLRGHQVEVAHDGPEALEKAAAFQPEVVLLDVGLPGLDGYQVASRLRGEGRTARALLVALTGYGQEEDQRRAREAGFDHHLTKPVDPRVIYELLASYPADQPALAT